MLKTCVNYLENKKYDDAITILNKVLQIHPKNIDGLHLIGLAFKEKKYFQKSREYFKKLLTLEKGNANIWCNNGLLHFDICDYGSAIYSYEKALELDPLHKDAWFNKGVALLKLYKFDQALNCFNTVLGLEKENKQTLNYIAYSHFGLGQYIDALKFYSKAINLYPNDVEILYDMGLTQINLKLYDSATSTFQKAYDIDADYKYLLGRLLYTRSLNGDYSSSDEKINLLIKNIEKENRAIVPFELLSIIDDPEIHLKAAKIWVHNEISELKKEKKFKIKKNEKIKVGYFSSDFKEHPVSFLISSLFESHDRSQFEIFAFSFQPPPIGDAIRGRLVVAVDHFIHLEGKSDEEISKIVEGFEIDIAIDLNGHTRNNRLEIFANRIAPIQVSYLGFPGTTGGNFIDYIIADRVVIPDEYKKFFTEKILYLPSCFLGVDDKRERSKRIFTKKECGLPDIGMVFCCFNNSYKFNKKIIESWVRILKAVDKSVMWIAENNENFRKNLIEEFNKLGIDSSRIIFAEKMRLIGDHLARLSLADLFLDTYPYSAHSTTIDSLKSDVPVLTILGKSFPSRVAASLVNALGLTELIAKNFTEYELAAIDFGLTPSKLKTIQERLILGKKNNVLFNNTNYTKQLELGFKSIYSRHQSGLGVDDVFIENLH